MSISDLSLSQPRLELTSKQQTILDALNAAVSQAGIEIAINHVPNFDKSTLLSIDVEHNESGEFVGCGIMVAESSRVYYYSDLVILSSLPFQTFSLIGHNGVSDMEMLRFWDKCQRQSIGMGYNAHISPY